MRRHLTPPEVRQRALDARAGCIAWELDRRHDEARIAAAITADPALDEALNPRMLDERRIGIVDDDDLLARVSAALAA